MMGVVVEFEANVEMDQEAAGDAHRKAEDVDGRIAFVSEKIPKRHSEIVQDQMKPNEVRGLKRDQAPCLRAALRRGRIEKPETG